jgi:hypothetical protein
MKGDAAMTQALVWPLLIGLVGLIWEIFLSIRGEEHHHHDKQIESPSPEPHDGEEAHERSSRQSKVAA